MSTLARGQRGFTIAELLIALALMGFLMVAAALGIQAAQTSYAYNSEKTDLVAKTRGTLDRITQHIRMAAAFEVPDSGTLVVTLPNGSTHTYQWDGVANGNLTYTRVDDSPYNPVVLTDRVTTFVVTDVSPACGVRLVLVGNRATTEATITATPRKAIY